MSIISVMRRWYLLQCKPRQAFRAQEHLRNQGYETFLPTLAREVLRRGKPARLTEPLFPHYLFIRLSHVADSWAPIRSTRGVSRLVTFGDLPLPVADVIVFSLQLREQGSSADGAAQPLWVPGQPLEIRRGPLAGLEAVFAARDGDERVIVLLKLINQQQSVKVALKDVVVKG